MERLDESRGVKIANFQGNEAHRSSHSKKMCLALGGGPGGLLAWIRVSSSLSSLSISQTRVVVLMRLMNPLLSSALVRSDFEHISSIAYSLENLLVNNYSNVKLFWFFLPTPLELDGTLPFAFAPWEIYWD
jgi:hypothetical protein